VTIAYSATSGAELWESRYDGPQHSQDEADVVASSPDGQRVFVTGYSNGANGYYDYATVAYDSATGAQLWTQRYDGSGAYWDVAQSLAVRPDGAEVVVTGYSDTVDHLYDFATIAYVA